jgi:hypothetical protein
VSVCDDLAQSSDSQTNSRGSKGSCHKEGPFMARANGRARVGEIMFTPYRQHAITFCTLAADVVEASLSNDSAKISGRWKMVYARQVRPSDMLEDFANWPSEPNEILRFTKKHGPLMLRHLGQGQTFSFDVADWRECQRLIQEDWRPRRPALGWNNTLDAEQGESFLRIHGNLTYIASTLFRLLRLELHAIPSQRLRRCVRPECENPYFIAKHLSQRYCSDLCANWAQKKWKREWWDARGSQLRRRKTAARAKK